MLRRRLLVLSLGIAGFWLAMMALLLRHELFTPYLHLDPKSAVLPSGPTDTWLGLLLNDASQTPIGYMNIQTAPLVRDGTPGVEMRATGRMHLNLGSFEGELAIDGSAWASPSDGVRIFSIEMRSGEHATTIHGEIDKGRLRGSIDSGGETTPLDLAMGHAQMLISAPGLGAATMPELNVGEDAFVDAFDPLTMSSGRAHITCVSEDTIQVMGKPVRTKVFLTDLSGIKSKAWVDASGNVLRAETPIGFVLQRMTAEEAVAMASGKQANEAGLLAFAAINPTGPAPFRGATRMCVEISGIEAVAGIPIDESQTRGPNGGDVCIAPVGPADTPNPLSSDRLADALANDAFLQTDNPRIIAKAREITGDEADTWKRALRIYEWVHASVKKNIVPSLPTALDVLDTMEGDCNEHTVLYTALARAAGIPTRMAIGLVWSEEFHAFYYHAWPEVYAGRWVWVDPTLGQPIADATHIKFINGDLISWWRIAPFMGNIKLRILEVK